MSIAESLNKKAVFIGGNGTAIEIIADAERALGLVFADDYREYLLSYSCGMYDGHELTGISKSARVNVVDVTLSLKQYDVSIPKDWYAIEETGIDGIIIWQDCEGKIYQNRSKICNSLIEYIDNF